MSDELERKHPVSDEETKDDDVEAHRRATDEGATEGEGDDDVEAHRKHLGADDENKGDDDVEAHRHHLGRQHGGA